ncbi:MAG: SH3 domain-containing protein [Clostridia bacterium]|nr:SH3 domain-containing protein [Clostridia bacterium]
MISSATKRIITFLLAVLLVYFCAFSCPVALKASAADAAFEQEIAAFPASYKPYLRALHEKYPNWKFRMLNTGLDWSVVIREESSKNRNLVPKGDGSSDLLKSKAAGDYNSKTGTYIEKDAGWVTANSIAVSYFMDPRNFLNETDIFQFELLSFSDAITVNTVEKVLEGTFMHDAKITYFNSNGTKKTINKKYAQVIYNAGKENNINPCYLAAKIRNEVVVSGGGGSGSVIGKYSGYEGIYNFYNIGAYDGKNPIKNGLKWASSTSDKSYGRPWTNPEKSIMGGAQWLAEKYIARGQDTGYLQKFDVAPTSAGNLYNHQYMTNVSGADSQGYTTYQSYSELGIMELERVFSIPVFNNMPGSSQQTGEFRLLDSYGQTTTITASTLNLRSIASTKGSVVAKIPSGTKINVLSKGKVDSDYYNYYLKNPFWYNISVVLDGVTYTGYISADYVNVKTSVNIKRGTTFNLPTDIKTAEKPTYYTSDSSVVSVNADGSLSALKNGVAEITAVTSNGGYDFIKINVCDYDSSHLKVNNFSVSGENGAANFTWSQVSGASGYDILVYQGNNLLGSATVSGSACSASISGLPVSQKLTSKIRAFTNTETARTNGEFTVIGDFTINPEQVKNLRCVDVTKSSFALDWDDVNDITGYEIYKYDNTLKGYKLIRNVTESYYRFSSVKAGFSSSYKVRAYKTVGNQNYYGEFSLAETGYTYRKSLTGLAQADISKTAVKLTWEPFKNATKYELYRLDLSSGELKKIDSTKKTTYTVKKLSVNTKYVFTVVAYVTVDGKSVKYAGSDIEINTLPYAPKNLSSKAVTSTGYTLYWGKVENVVKYRIYRYDEATGKYKRIKTVTDTEYTVETEALTEGKYKIKAGVKSGGKTVYSAYSSSITVKSAPAKVKGLKYTDNTTSSYTLTWNKVEGKISGYLIYKYDNASGKYKYLDSTKKTSYKVKGLSSGKTDYYIVRAYIKKSGKKIKSDESKRLKVKTLPSKVKNVLISAQTTDGFTLSWAPVNGAKGYEIYVYSKNKGKYVRTAKTSDTSYTFTDRAATKTTKYKVRAYLYIDSKKLNGKFSSVFTANTLPADTKKVTVKQLKSGKQKISWSEVRRAGWYRIYILNSETGEYDYVGKTEECSYTLNPLQPGQNSVMIKACMKVNKINYYSEGKIKSFSTK